jgi:DNA-binding CsgD family transcriptional regulator
MACMPPPRGQVLRDRLAVATAGASDVEGVGHRVLTVLRRFVPFEYACLATTDPATGLITGAIKSSADDMGEEEFAHYEYAVDDLNQFAEIARRPVPVGVLSRDTGGRPEQSPRFRDYLRPRFGFGDELRIAFRSHHHTWGGLSLYRDAGAVFTVAEAAVVTAAGDVVADVLRRRLLEDTGRFASSLPAPAVLLVGPDDRIRQTTPGADRALDQLGEWRGASLPSPLLAAITSARAGAGSPSARVRTAAGGWLVVHASRLRSPHEDTPGTRNAPDVVVTIHEAGPDDLRPLTLAALGLTDREQDVAGLVLRGFSTREICASLHLSPYTVQDHLKAVFTKADVRSRRDLVAKLSAVHAAATRPAR